MQNNRSMKGFQYWVSKNCLCVEWFKALKQNLYTLINKILLCQGQTPLNHEKFKPQKVPHYSDSSVKYSPFKQKDRPVRLCIIMGTLEDLGERFSVIAVIIKINMLPECSIKDGMTTAVGRKSFQEYKFDSLTYCLFLR